MSVIVNSRHATRLLIGDCMVRMAELEDCSIDAIVTDPDYEFIVGAKVKGWGGVPKDAWAQECLRVLKPGGHILAFGGSRTWHRLAVAIEDAGFEMRDSIAWLYGSGFPKSLDVSKAIDKDAGHWRGRAGAVVSGNGSMENPNRERTDKGDPITNAAREWAGWGTAMKPGHEPVVCARKPFDPVPLEQTIHEALGVLLWLSLSPAKRAELVSASSLHALPGAASASALVSAATATSPDAYAGTATFNSPALASTCWNIVSSWNAMSVGSSAPTITSTTSTRSSTTTVLRTLNSLLAPLISQITTQASETLRGGLLLPVPSAADHSSAAWENWTRTLRRSVPESATEGIALAVASLLVDTVGECSDAPAAGLTADPAATTTVGGSSTAFEPIVVGRKPLIGTVAANVLAHGTGALNIDACRIDGVGAEAGRTRHGGGVVGAGSSYELPDSHGEMPAGRWPANVVLDESQAATLDEQSGASVSRKGKPRESAESGNGWGMTKTGAEYDDKGGASRFFYVAKAPKSQRPNVDGVAHPTVKPLDLMRWLVRLVTPPGGTVLDPFVGSGTTMEAAVLEGFSVIGIERDRDYVALIKQRMGPYRNG